jgi:E3 ubiquitin-protein ligase HUWE1
LDAHFTKSFYKHILGIPVVFSDLESIDPELHKHLTSFLIRSNVQELETYFEVTEDQFGILKTKPLITNGENILVTDKVYIENEIFLKNCVFLLEQV